MRIKLSIIEAASEFSPVTFRVRELASELECNFDHSIWLSLWLNQA
jgi:hypothetical protein